jgi:SnoaL-like domain
MEANEIVDTYMAAWNESDETKRNQMLDRCWSATGTYTDPMADIKGREALSALISQFQQQMPDALLVTTTGVDAHHDRVRFGWKLQAPDGATRMEGIDIGQLAADGKLQSIVGFWGTNPPEA